MLVYEGTDSDYAVYDICSKRQRLILTVNAGRVGQRRNCRFTHQILHLHIFNNFSKDRVVVVVVV